MRKVIESLFVLATALILSTPLMAFDPARDSSALLGEKGVYDDDHPNVYPLFGRKTAIFLNNKHLILRKKDGQSATYETTDFDNIRFVRHVPRSEPLAKEEYFFIQATHKISKSVYFVPTFAYIMGEAIAEDEPLYYYPGLSVSERRQLLLNRYTFAFANVTKSPYKPAIGAWSPKFFWKHKFPVSKGEKPPTIDMSRLAPSSAKSVYEELERAIGFSFRGMELNTSNDRILALDLENKVDMKLYGKLRAVSEQLALADTLRPQVAEKHFGSSCRLASVGFALGQRNSVFSVSRENDECVFRAVTGAELRISIGDLTNIKCDGASCKFDYTLYCTARSGIMRHECAKLLQANRTFSGTANRR